MILNHQDLWGHYSFFCGIFIVLLSFCWLEFDITSLFLRWVCFFVRFAFIALLICPLLFAVLLYISLPVMMSHYPVCLSLIRSSRRRGRRRPRLPMRGGSNWLSSVSRLRRLLRRSWDLSWRFLPQSSTDKLCTSPVLRNIWPLILSSLVKLCDSITLSGKTCYPSACATVISNIF